MIMSRVIAVCSGKGGVGKTTVAANLGLALQKLGKTTAVIDTNFTTAHLGIYFGILNNQLSLNDFLKGTTPMANVIQSHPTGLKIIPASLSLKDLDVDFSGFAEAIRNELGSCDFIILDSAPGFGKEALISLGAADELLLVANPYLPSVVDISKARELVMGMEKRPALLGIILNRVRKKSYELNNDEVRAFTEIPVMGTIPESEKILASSNRKSQMSSDKGPAHPAFMRIASRLSAVEYKESLVSRIFSILRL
jgi:septum site-determining protein MinD